MIIVGVTAGRSFGQMAREDEITPHDDTKWVVETFHLNLCCRPVSADPLCPYKRRRTALSEAWWSANVGLILHQVPDWYHAHGVCCAEHEGENDPEAAWRESLLTHFGNQLIRLDHLTVEQADELIEAVTRFRGADLETRSLLLLADDAIIQMREGLRLAPIDIPARRVFDSERVACMITSALAAHAESQAPRFADRIESVGGSDIGQCVLHHHSRPTRPPAAKTLANLRCGIASKIGRCGRTAARCLTQKGNKNHCTTTREEAMAMTKRSWSINALELELGRDRRIIVKALANIPADGHLQGKPAWRLKTALQVLEIDKEPISVVFH